MVYDYQLNETVTSTSPTGEQYERAFLARTTEEEIQEEELRATHTVYTYWIWRHFLVRQ